MWASAVVTSWAKALPSASPGDFVPHDEKTVVYLVTVKGHLVARAASVPPGAHAPTGTYMSMVIDAKTFAGLNFGWPQAAAGRPGQLRASDLAVNRGSR